MLSIRVSDLPRLEDFDYLLEVIFVAKNRVDGKSSKIASLSHAIESF